MPLQLDLSARVIAARTSYHRVYVVWLRKGAWQGLELAGARTTASMRCSMHRGNLLESSGPIQVLRADWAPPATYCLVAPLDTSIQFIILT